MKFLKNSKQVRFIDTKLGYGYPIKNYGRWYIGPEEGGDQRENSDRIDTWFNLSKIDESFVDLREFHMELAPKLIQKSLQDTSRFFVGKKCIQSTWGGIIEIDNSICGLETPNRENKRNYQVMELAREGNPICLLELSPFSSRALNDLAWNDKK